MEGKIVPVLSRPKVLAYGKGGSAIPVLSKLIALPPKPAIPSKSGGPPGSTIAPGSPTGFAPSVVPKWASDCSPPYTLAKSVGAHPATSSEIPLLPVMPRPGVSAEVIGQLCRNDPNLFRALGTATNKRGGKGSDPTAMPPGLLPLANTGEEAPLGGTIIVPGVKELCEKFNIEKNVAQLLDNQLRQRMVTYEGDLETLQCQLEQAKSPAAHLMVKIKELQQGTFVGLPANHREITDMAEKYQLDEQAVEKLTETLVRLGKEKAESAIKQLSRHLANSNKPSAFVMMSLAKLRKGEDLGEPTHRPAPGSYAYEQEKQAREAAEQEKQKGRSFDDDRDRRYRDQRDRGGGAGGDRGSGRDRDRERGRHQDRGWERDHRDSGRNDHGRADHDRSRDRGRDRDSGRDHRHREHGRDQGWSGRRDSSKGRDLWRDREKERDDRGHTRGGREEDRGGRKHGWDTEDRRGRGGYERGGGGY